LFATYTKVDYNTAATAMFCSGPNTPVRNLVGVNPVAFNNVAGLTGCDPDFKYWAVGTRTIWNPVPNLDIGLEIVYTKIETSYDPTVVRLSFAGAGGRAAGLYVPSNEEVWSGVFRVQRNFWP
jgi:Porin subfamily